MIGSHLVRGGKANKATNEVIDEEDDTDFQDSAVAEEITEEALQEIE